jgi:hypothetical protein
LKVGTTPLPREFILYSIYCLWSDAENFDQILFSSPTVEQTPNAMRAIPAIKAEKRKSSRPWLTKKTKPSTTEVKKPKSTFAKIRATVKGKKS